MRIRLDLSYDGTDFHGWAAQPGLRTVQGELQRALDTILRLEDPARLTVAGRTDAGVHARGQVAHLDIPQTAWDVLPGRDSRPAEQVAKRKLNALLPPDIAVHSVALAPEGFDARFSAIWREYSYRITHVRDPLNRRFALLHEPVSLDALNDAARLLVGERDFAAFCKARPGASAIRTLEHFSFEPWREAGATIGAVGNLRADAFCHNMVRSLVGACLAVGSGRKDLQWLAEVAGMDHRSSQVHVAPGHPLVLEGVGYPPAHMFAARAERTRAVRTLPSAAAPSDV